jgi:hypothetical protein
LQLSWEKQKGDAYMSNIIPISEKQVIYSQDPTQKPTNELFKNSLEKALQNRPVSNLSQGSPSLPEIQATAPYLAITSTEKVTSQTSRLLDLLDTYAKNLESPSITLRNMVPLTEEIRLNAQELLQETEKIPQDQTKLRGIATSAVIAAEVELFKFNRGDYV